MMMTDNRNQTSFERMVGRVLWSGVAASSVLLAAGLLLSLADRGNRLAGLMLATAIVILLATPAARVVLSVIEYTRERDWPFVALTATVLLTLAGSVAVAFWTPVIR
jgi:uncharacterized membrane protein